MIIIILIKLSNISLPHIISDISSLPICNSNTLNTSLITLLDKHAPECIVTTVYRPNSSWHTPLLRNQKRLLRNAERVYQHNPTSYTLVNYRNFYLLKNNYRKNLICAKKMNTHSKNVHHLVMTVNLFIVYPRNYLVGTKKPHLSYTTPEQLPILFDTFLHKKNCLL